MYHANARIFLVFLALLIAGAGRIQAEPLPDFSVRSYEVYVAAKQEFLAKSGQEDVEAAWKFAKACFDYAEFATNDNQRASIANEGIAAARKALAADPNSAVAHYYLGMNLGQLARTKSLGALKLVREMEVEFKRAIELDPKCDFAGPERSLGMLYLEAPGWPTSIGSKSKAREHLERAVKLAPEFPDNFLSLAEAYLKWHERDELFAVYATFKKSLDNARDKFTGPDWEQAWLDWTRRWSAIQKEVRSRDE